MAATYRNLVLLPIATLITILSIFNSLVQCKSVELTFELPDNAKQCFHEDIPAGTKANIEFQVVTGGYYDVDMTLYDPRQTVIYQGIKKQFDTHQWTASIPGQYTFCFNNEFSTFSHKLVYFDFTVGEEDPLPNATNQAATAMTKIEATAAQIHENLNQILNAQTHYRLNESQGRKRAEDLNSHVNWWSALETFAVVLGGVVQVLILRSFFSNRRSGIPTT